MAPGKKVQLQGAGRRRLCRAGSSNSHAAGPAREVLEGAGRGWKPRLRRAGKGFFNTHSLAGTRGELPGEREGCYERRLSTPAAGAEEEGTVIVMKD